ncbi:MAG: hypothetical protein LWW79_07585 [Holophagaceae bacterium]|nr:hypothetical protein [Holophagaceae bacterium]
MGKQVGKDGSKEGEKEGGKEVSKVNINKAKKSCVDGCTIDIRKPTNWMDELPAKGIGTCPGGPLLSAMDLHSLRHSQNAEVMSVRTGLLEPTMLQAARAAGIHPTVIKQVYSLTPPGTWTVEHALCGYLAVNSLRNPALRPATMALVKPIVRSLGSCLVADLDLETLRVWFHGQMTKEDGGAKGRNTSDRSGRARIHRRAAVLRAALAYAHHQGWAGADAALHALVQVVREWHREMVKRSEVKHREQVQALLAVLDPKVRAKIGFSLWNQMRALAIRGMWPTAPSKTSKSGGEA